MKEQDYLRQYVEESRARGISDREIRGRLISSGWHPNKVYSILPVKNSIKYTPILAVIAVLLVMILINYLPMFLFGTGPILLMGLYGIFLMAYLPIFAGIFFLMTAFYQQTGRIYLGAIMATFIVVWIMTAGMMI